MPRSYLDGADLARLRALGPGPAEVALACLLDAGVVQHDPDEPDWPDRDRLLVDPALPLMAVAEAARRAGYPLEEGYLGQGPGRVAADAVRAARASQAAGDVYRVFLVLDAVSLADGAVYEALLAAAADALTPLTLLVLPPAPPDPNVNGLARMRAKPFTLEAVGVLRALGWRVEQAAAEPAEVLGALDRVLARPAGPGGVVLQVRLSSPDSVLPS